MQSHTIRRITSAHAALSLHTQLGSYPHVHHRFVWSACPSRASVQRRASATHPHADCSQSSLDHVFLKGLRTCVHHNRTCLCS